MTMPEGLRLPLRRPSSSLGCKPPASKPPPSVSDTPRGHPGTPKRHTLEPSAAEGLRSPFTGVDVDALARLTPDSLRPRLDTTEDTAPTPTARPGARSAGHRRGPTGANSFVRQVEKTVDTLQGVRDETSFEDVQHMLTNIRQQYNDVHCEVNKRKEELQRLHRAIHLKETERRPPPNTWNGMTQAELEKRMERAAAAIDEELETKHVYEHMVARLKRELNIVRHKVQLMEKHLQRKTSETVRQAGRNCLLHEKKVLCINELEAMTQEAELEREVRQNALEDLEATSRLRQDEVRHRWDFEHWRYNVAADAAFEAFQASAGRLRKLYAIEKLTGNYLQRVSYEQMERSQITEDGFQQIREVTGLTDVMDIVHKFLNRDVEHEQLNANAREVDVRFESLCKAEAVAKSAAESAQNHDPVQPGRLHNVVAQHEHQLAKSIRDQEEIQLCLRRNGVLFEGIKHWAQRIARSFALLEELCPVESQADVTLFFGSLLRGVEKLLDRARADPRASQRLRPRNQRGGRRLSEEQEVLADQEFMRVNCRVPASLDASRHPHNGHHDDPRHREGEEERKDLELFSERDRIKVDSQQLAGARDAHHQREHPGSRRRGSITTIPKATARTRSTIRAGLVGQMQSARRGNESALWGNEMPPGRDSIFNCGGDLRKSMGQW